MNALVLKFTTKGGKTASLRIPKSRVGVTKEEVQALADLILAKNLFFSGDKEFAALESCEEETSTFLI